MIKRLAIMLSTLFLLACQVDSGSDVQIKQYEGQGWFLLDENHGDAGSAWGVSDCAACHLIKDIHRNEKKLLKNLVIKKGYQTCAGCHGNNNTQIKRECVICHNDQDLDSSPYTLGNKAHNFQSNSDKSLASLLNDEACIDCHKLSDMNGLFDKQVDLTRLPDHNNELQPYRNESEFCLRCHNNEHQVLGFEIPSSLNSETLSRMKDNYEFFDRHGYVEGSGERTYSGLRKNASSISGYKYQTLVECSDCHEMHGTHNEKLIIPSSQVGLSKLDIEFRQKNHSISVLEDDYSQLCVMCHVMEIPLEKSDQDTGNGLSGVHETSSECLSCHKHGSAAQVGL